MRSCRHPNVEALLQRILLSVSVVKETLTIEGGSEKDDISLGVHPQVVNLMSLKINGDESLFLLGSFKVINIKTLGGNDVVRIGEMYDGAPSYLNIDLGPGHDRFYGSSADETIIGGSGNDRISAGAGEDSVNAGVGDDVVVGDEGADTLVGLDGNDSLFGGDGDDSLSAGAGDDSIECGNGFDTVSGGDGNDRILNLKTLGSSIRKASRIDGDNGDDYILVEGDGTHSFSSVYGGAGADYLIDRSFKATSSLTGGDGNDRLIGGQLRGGNGEDRLVAASTDEAYLYGEAGNDYLFAGDARSGSAHGGDGNDTLDSAAFNVELWGDADQDLLIYAGSRVYGGSGNDLIRPASGVNLTRGVLIDGGWGNDTLYGTALNDTIHGSDGDDLLHGGSGPDSIMGDKGNDTIYGGNGIDTLFGGDGNDSFFGGGSNDRKTSDDGNDYAYGEAGSDYFDPNHLWTETDADPDDVNRPVTINPTRPPGGGGGSGSVITRPTTPDFWNGERYVALGLMGRSAVFSGVANLTGTGIDDQPVLTPALTAAERKAIRPHVIRVPADWALTRLGKSGGLVWYRVEPRSTSWQGRKQYGYATLKLRKVDPQSPAAMSAQDYLGVYSMAVHPSSVLTEDGTNEGTITSLNWNATSFAAPAIVTRKPFLMIEGGEQITFTPPPANLLASVTLVSGQRYLYTSAGFRAVTEEGIGAIIA